MYVWMLIFIYVFIYARIFESICICICICLYLCIYVCMHVCICVLGNGKMDFWLLNPVMRLEILLIIKGMSILIIDWIN